MSKSNAISSGVAMLGLAVTACGEVTRFDPPVDAPVPGPDGGEPATCVEPPAGLTA